MSKQLNFFACGHDEYIIFEIVFKVFLDGLFFISDRGESKIMVPQPLNCLSDLAAFNAGKFVYLVPAPAIDLLTLEDIPGGEKFLASTSSPVIEYSPSKVAAPHTIDVGRFAYFFCGDEVTDRLVDQLFRKLKKIAKKLAHYQGCWIFPQAEQEANFLDFGGGTLIPNPLKRPV